MMDNYASICLEDEHDWCTIPLHEDAQICARCSEIKKHILSDSIEDSNLPIGLVVCGQQEY
jgi:hypothetical protein